MRETDRWPLTLARFWRIGPTNPKRTVRVIVIHDMEYGETLEAAEDVAHYFATMPDNRQASAHVCIDADSVIQCVRDSDIAYAAPGANHDGIQIELAGTARQTREQWLDDYGKKLLDRAAHVVAQYLVKYSLPVRHLTDTELANGRTGIVGHDQVSRVYKRSDHTDPGPNFPWGMFIPLVQQYYQDRLAEGS